jgi:Zn-dependent protease
MDFSEILKSTAWILPVLLAVTLHEAAHGWMAERFGDKTARNLGRVTFNPIKHIDPIGTVILPALLVISQSPVLFGYAKPVPVNFMKLQPKRFGMLMVAAAGPGANILLALISGLLLHLGAVTSLDNMQWWQLNLFNSLLINCALAIFNMLPILPLDGGRVMRSLLSGNIGRKYAETERYGMFVVIGLIIIPSLIGVNFVMDALSHANGWLIGGILQVTGH